MAISWGLLGPAMAVGERRSRTLGLGSVVRRFNELTVPGIGGVWFGKQLLLAALGLRVAGLAQATGRALSNVECANALEAVGCWLDLDHRQWQPDPRLRGSSKLPRVHALDFRSVRKKTFYVTQPMRMATVLAMQPLGLAQSSSRRFNAFALTADGEAFIDAACREFSPYNRDVTTHLCLWAQGQEGGMKTPALRRALSPCTTLPAGARDLLRDRLLRGGVAESVADKVRRRDAMAWVDAVRGQPSLMNWDQRPPQISEAHWADMRAGARLFATRDAAIELLDALEQQVARAPQERWLLQDPVPALLVAALENLKTLAAYFLDLNHRDAEANAFCRECTRGSAAQILGTLVERDGRVLRRVGDEVRPGSAFRRQPPPQGVDDDVVAETPVRPETAGLKWPSGLSFRIKNLYLLNLDLHGELDDGLASELQQGAQA